MLSSHTRLKDRRALVKERGVLGKWHASGSPIEAEIESKQAVFRAVLVDLEARAKYAKIEGAGVPLLVHAKSLNDDLRGLIASTSENTRKRFEPNFAYLNGQLRTVALAFAHLCRRDVRPHGKLTTP